MNTVRQSQRLTSKPFLLGIAIGIVFSLVEYASPQSIPGNLTVAVYGAVLVLLSASLLESAKSGLICAIVALITQTLTGGLLYGLLYLFVFPFTTPFLYRLITFLIAGALGGYTVTWAKEQRRSRKATKVAALKTKKRSSA